MNYVTRKLVLITIFFLISSNQLLAKLPVSLPESTPSVWMNKNIVASHVNYGVAKSTGETATKLNQLKPFVLIEPDGKHVTVFDVNKLEPIIRFSVRSVLQGKPIYDSTSHYVYLLSRDGWISKFDLQQLKMVSEIRPGLDSSSLAISSDDRFIIVGNNSPKTLVVLDANNLDLLKVIPTVDRKGKSSPVSAVFDAKPRRSFLASFNDIPELWEISYQTPPPAGFGEWVHDYRKDSGEAEVKSFPVRRLSLTNSISDFFLDQEYVHVIGSSDKGKGQVVDLDLGRKVFDLDLPDKQERFSGVSWRIGKKRILATPNRKGDSINIVDMKDWREIKSIPILGTTFSIHSYENSPYVWVISSLGKDKEVIQVIDKESLEIVKKLQLQAGKSIKLLRVIDDDRYVLIAQGNSNVIVYDAKTLDEIKRITIKPEEASEVYK